MQRKSIIFTPLNSADWPLALSRLGISYQSRYEWFGDVKDIVRQQFKAHWWLLRHSIVHADLQSLPTLERHVCVVLNDLGRGRTSTLPSNNIWKPLLLFHSTAYTNPISSGVWEIHISVGLNGLGIYKTWNLHLSTSDAVASTPLNNPNRPGVLASLGISYLLRFQRFGKKKDIDSAIEQQLEAVASTAPGSLDRAIYLNDLGNSYSKRFTHFGDVNDIDSAINQQLEAVASTLPNNAKRDIPPQLRTFV